jgi:MoxR-like ATPase
MSIAILVESEVEAGKEQTLLVPTTNDVIVFHRLSNGQRGRGQAWQIVTELVSLSDSPVTHEPVGVILTQRDLDNAGIGNVTALSIKAMSYGKGAPRQSMSHSDLVMGLQDRLIAGDMSLNNYVLDGRRSNPITLKPILPQVANWAEQVQQEQLQQVALIVPKTDTPTTDNVVSFPKKVVTDVAKVPDQKWADTYLNRKVEGGISDFDLFDVAMKNHENILIRGHAGSGKTMSVLAYASARNLRYYNVSSNVGLEPSHLFGSWIPTEAGSFAWQDGAVTSVVRHGGVLLLNEIDFMPERITTVLFSLLDDRRQIQLMENGGEIIEAHPDLLVIGDHNPNYRGSRPMNQAWKDRFHHKVEFPYDKSIERKLIPSASLLEIADKLRVMADKGEIDTPISTRSLVALVNNSKQIGIDYAIASYVNGFLDDEKEAVKLVMETAKSTISSELGVK